MLVQWTNLITSNKTDSISYLGISAQTTIQLVHKSHYVFSCKHISSTQIVCRDTSFANFWSAIQISAPWKCTPHMCKSLIWEWYASWNKVCSTVMAVSPWRNSSQVVHYCVTHTHSYISTANIQSDQKKYISANAMEGKCQHSVSMTAHHEGTRNYGGKGPYIIILCTRWIWEVSFKLWPSLVVLGCDTVWTHRQTQHFKDMLTPEDGGSMFLQNNGIYLWVFMSSQPRTTRHHYCHENISNLTVVIP
jgi:hypothetical protein